MANALQHVSMQTEINKNGVLKLRAYFEDFVEFLSGGDKMYKSIGDQIPELLYQLEQLVMISLHFSRMNYRSAFESFVLFPRDVCNDYTIGGRRDTRKSEAR